MAKGGDPAGDRVRQQRAPRVRDLWKRYLDEHARPKLRPKSVREDTSKWERFIEPALGKVQVAAVNRGDISTLHSKLSDRPIMGNRVLALLSSMFTFAERWGYRAEGTKPCRYVQRYPERNLSGEELGTLGDTLAEVEAAGSEPPEAIAAIRLQLFTGCRKSEILTLKWEYVDLERRLIFLPESRTGAKALPLGAPTLRVLSTIPRIEGNPYVITGRNGRGHLVGLQHIWARIRQQAGIPDVRLHDLRHSFASTGAGIGLSLPVIGRLLGHRQAATTQRYAHLADDPIHLAVDRISGELEAALKQDDDGDAPLIARMDS